MGKTINIPEKFKIPRIGRLPLYPLLVILVFILAVLQDYIYSRIQNTGFYLSESSLYNTFWIYFIPFSIIANRLLKVTNKKNTFFKLPLKIGIGLFLSILHIVLFASLFVLVSSLIYNPTHRFSAIYNSALSNQFYIALLWYIIFPAIHSTKPKSSNLNKVYSDKIKLKIGSKIINTSTSMIQCITTDKPYSVVYINDKRLLENKSLKEFETELDPSIFIRVHRSSIINATYVKELKSRNNGDYDATLQNDLIIRLSRHFRHNWKQLIQ
ncbi:LytTR family DNA-binding domain-containing protein [Winogradskyella maritima]|uniref:LytTR family DNA-binding domain-containing protein n=1 Tax=Winogradskyella maritima TaxID=1517766 RepID=A0ABV8AL45_9FLAO|nr:LytTR family DNA-binding domain-containing protein [Winogradskyella maritima]